MSKRNIFKKPSQFFKEIDNLRNKGEERGEYLGFKILEDKMSFKEGCTTILYGAPYSGKSQFTFEILINLSMFYGQNHAIYSPETGSKEAIAAEIMSAYCKVRHIYSSDQVMDSAKYERAKRFLDRHFFIAEEYEGITIEGFFDSVQSIEQEHSIKIHTTVIDHMGLLEQDLIPHGGREDKWISYALTKVNSDAQKHKRHNVVVAHVTSQQPSTTNGVTWFPPAHPRQIAGGQNYFRLGQQIVLIWRPPTGLPDQNGIPYEDNAVVISVRKSKPKGVGRLGESMLYFDWRTNRYYEKNLNGSISYAEKKDEPQKELF